MASLQKPVTSALSLTAMGTIASIATDSRIWIVITTIAVGVAGIVAVVMNRIAKRYYR